MSERFFISPPFAASPLAVQAAVNTYVAGEIDKGRHAYYLPVEDRVVVTDYPLNVIGGIYLNENLDRTRSN